MKRLFACVFTIFGLGSCIVSAENAKTKSLDTKYADEAFVIEQTASKIAFENDGSSYRESVAKIRIQSDAGVQRYSVLTVPYEDSSETLEIDYVRVTRQDGSVISTPADGIQDMPAEITRQAPFYSDLREKHVPVKGLAVSDILEFKFHSHRNKPLVPGQFWFGYNFSHDGIVLSEELEVSMPRDRAVKWKSADQQPQISEEGGRKIFRWKSSQLVRRSSAEEKKQTTTDLYKASLSKLPAPDVLLSSFQSWEEVGRWYSSLQLDRVKPSREILAKAMDLTKSVKDEDGKLQAIYDYVSKQFRYIGIGFGIGRYQPHTAEEVLSNQYGDCKDKHTLLASLLQAVGIKAYPGLINSTHVIETDVPSPGQFDHVISVVPRGKDFLWLDSTAELARFGYLVGSLRGKPVLVALADQPPVLAMTPLDPPFKSAQTFQIKAKLSDEGTLEGKVDRTISGDDAELLLRNVFRRVPQPQWPELIQKLSYLAGFSGDVSDVTVSSPEQTNDPFRFAYGYKRKDYPDWSERHITAPLPPIELPDVDEEKSANPVWLGSPGEAHLQAEVELPKGYSPTLPKKVELKEDFAEYSSTYSLKNGSLVADRHFSVKLRQVPLNDIDLYKKFRKEVQDDHNRYIELSSGGSTARSYQEEIWQLPYSDNPEAARHYDEARNQYQRHDVLAEISSLKQAVQIDPNFTRAWLWLGEVYKAARETDLALSAYRKAIEIDQQPVSYKALAYTLMDLRRYEEAIPVWEDLIKADPEEVDGLIGHGSALMGLKRYHEACGVLEKAAKLDPGRAPVRAQLGFAYLESGEEEKAVAEFQTAIDLDSSPNLLNTLAYEMAEADKKLPLALEYAETAVREEEKASAQVNLELVTPQDFAHTAALVAFWDTLGWVHYRLRNFDKAEKYLQAAWAVSQDKVVGDHLSQLFVHLRKVFVNSPDQLSRMRTTKLRRITPGTASADFLVVIAMDPKTSLAKVESAKFIRGSPKLEDAVETLTSTSFKIPFPDNGPTRLVRQGILGCYPYTGCSFVLMNSGDARPVN